MRILHTLAGAALMASLGLSLVSCEFLESLMPGTLSSTTEATESATPSGGNAATDSQSSQPVSGTTVDAGGGWNITPGNGNTGRTDGNAPVATPSAVPTTAPTPEPSTVTQEEVTVFENGNIYGVYNQPTAETTFMLEAPVMLTYIETYHWNYAQGQPGGTIALKDDKGSIYGPWAVQTRPGQGGVPNAYWYAEPQVVLPAGDYTVVDSDPSTWAHNDANGNQGMTLVRGIPQ